MNKLLCILLCLLLFSCKQKITRDTLTQKEGIYYNGQPEKPYTGEVIFYDSTLRKERFVSASYNFTEGIPEGKWKAFGYKGETIMNGEFKSVTSIQPYIKIIPTLNRININDYVEDKDIRLIDVYLISQIKDTVISDDTRKKIVDLLMRENQITIKDSANIYTCQIYNGEF